MKKFDIPEDLFDITPRKELIIRKGLLDYQYIKDNWNNNGTKADFEKVYFDFYLAAGGARMRKDDNLKIYFDMMHDDNLGEDLLGIVLALRSKITINSYEFSFVSKMLHTRNNNIPIYDSRVRDYLVNVKNIKLWMNVKGAPRGKTIEEKIKHDWKILNDWYTGFLKSDSGHNWLEWFDNTFKEYSDILPVKKVDFIIFAKQSK